MNKDTSDSDGQYHLNVVFKWSSMPGWKAKEAAALFLGLDPIDYKRNQENDEYRYLCLRLRRAVRMNLIRSLCPPKSYLEWAIANNIEIPQVLQDSVKSGVKLKNWKKIARRLRKRLTQIQAEENNIENQKSLKSLMSILLLMALTKYRFKIGSNSNAVRNITDDFNQFKGNFPGEKTVRSWLKRAEQEVGGEFNRE